MAKVYQIEDDAERYVPVSLDDLVPGTQIPFEIFANDGTIIKSLLDKGSTYSFFAKEMIEKQGVSQFFIRQGNVLNLNEYMHNAAQLRKMILDPAFFTSRYRQFRDKWFLVDKHILNSGIPFTIPLGGMRFPVFGEIPFSIDNDATYRHLLDLNSDIVIRKQDVDAYYAYLNAVLDAEWIEDPVLKLKLRREKLKVWCHRVFEGARDNNITQENLLGLYRQIDTIIPLIKNNFKHAGKLLFFDASDIFLYVHSVNVCLLSLILGDLTNVEESSMLNLGIAAILHDIGRTALDDDINEHSQNDKDREVLKSHVIKGKEILEQYKDVPSVARLVAMTHHERVDGSGYLYNMKGEEIYIFSKIVAVGDCFENYMVTGYKDVSMNRSKSLDALLVNAGKYDPEILKAFVRFIAGVSL
jgi:putative nucleotidyltransferase with HDIG domain